jgi:hypothetical protein
MVSGFGLLRSAKRNGPFSTSPALLAVRLMMGGFVLSWVTGPGLRHIQPDKVLHVCRPGLFADCACVR